MNPADSFFNVELRMLCLTTIMIYCDLLTACNEVCGYKKNRKCNVNMWWWNCGVKDEIQKKETAYKEMERKHLKKHKMNTGD